MLKYDDEVGSYSELDGKSDDYNGEETGENKVLKLEHKWKAIEFPKLKLKWVIWSIKIRFLDGTTYIREVDNIPHFNESDDSNTKVIDKVKESEENFDLLLYCICIRLGSSKGR